jgi:antirestriction protein ArdC
MDTYAIVTEKIVNLLEQGIVPWRRPWSATGLPRNLVSKKPYRGINVFLLSATKYVSPFWLTMKQANELGGSVHKGEHSQIVVFWKVDQIPIADSESDSEEHGSDNKTHRRIVLRYYRLFNLEQCELPQAVLDKLPKIETHQHDPIEAAERIIVRMPNPPEIQYAGSQAFYSTITDRITCPRASFSPAPKKFMPAFSMRHLMRQVHRSGSTANRSPKPRRLARPCTVSRNLSRNVQPLISAPRRESLPPS